MKPWAAMSREERIQALAPMLAAGMPTRLIAEEIGAGSKNVIIGFVHRWMTEYDRLTRAEAVAQITRRVGHGLIDADDGIPLPVLGRPLKRHRSSKASPSAIPKRRRMPEAFKPAPPPVVVVEPILFRAREMGRECAWIIGDPRTTEAHGIRCCGQPAVDGLEWCSRHKERAFVKRVA